MTTIRSARRGVTLLELIIVIGLLLILAALLLPAVQKVRQAAARTQSMNNLKMLGLAIHNYNDVNKKLPPAAGKAGVADGTVFFHVLPYLEHENLYKSAFFNEGAQGALPQVNISIAPASYSAGAMCFEGT